MLYPRIEIYFENIIPLHYPLVKYHVWRKHDLYVFDFNCDLKKQKWLRGLINNGKVQWIFVKQLIKEQGEAMDQTEIIYQNMKNKELPQIISSLYKSDEVWSVFKRKLSREIFKCLYLNSYFGERKPGQKFCFAPEKYKVYENLLKKYGNYNLDSFRKIKLHKIAYFLSWFMLIYEKFKYYLAVLFYLFVIIILLIKGRTQKVKTSIPAYFKYVVSLDQPSQIKFNGLRSFDFLLDKGLRKEEVLFLLKFPVTSDWIKPYREQNYNILNLKEVNGIRNLIKGGYKNASSTRKVIRSLLKMLWERNAPTPFLHAFLLSVRTFVGWQLFYARVSFEKYIYTNCEGDQQLLLNLLIRQSGGSSYDYSSFVGGPYLRSQDEEFFPAFRHISRSYLNSDYFLAVNEDAIKYYKLHSQKIRSYYPLGSIYSEMVKKTMEKFDKKDIFKKYFKGDGYDSSLKVISFFDTSFIDSPEAPSTFEDCLGFYQDIIKLVNSSKDLRVIVKPSKDEAWFIQPDHQWSSLDKGEKVIQLWRDLQSNPKVCWAGDSGDVPTIMALSDLVITHCMSSPTVEALGARKKAIWYESGEKHRGVIYDKIFGLIAHGYKELEERVEYYLYGISDDEYNAYLDKYVKGKVESHLDGLALTRFRQLLSGKEELV